MSQMPRARSDSTLFFQEEYYLKEIEKELDVELLTQEIIDRAQSIYNKANQIRIWKTKDPSIGFGTSVTTYLSLTEDRKRAAEKLIEIAKYKLAAQTSPKSSISFEKIVVKSFFSSSEAAQ